MAAREATEQEKELALLCFVEPVFAAVLGDIKDSAGVPRVKLAIIDVMGHGGSSVAQEENTPGSTLFPAFRLSGHHAGARLAGDTHRTVVPVIGRAAEGLAAIARSG